MADLAALQSELERFGLNPAQARIYLLLVSHGDLRVQDIVQLAQLPRSSVYEHLKHLIELGIVEECIDGTFKKYRAYPVGALRHALDEEIAQLQQRASDLDVLERSISIVNRADGEPTSVHYYRARSGARQLLWNTLQAKSTVYVYSEWDRQRFVGLPFYERFAAEARRRGIAEHVLINSSQATFQDIKKRNAVGSPIARTRVEDIRVAKNGGIHIKGDTFIYDDIYAQLYLKDVEIHGFEIQSHDFARTQCSIFEMLWQASAPVSTYLAK